MSGEARDRKWWDRWVVGFWIGVAIAGLAYPFLHPPEIRVIQFRDGDFDKIGIATAHELFRERGDNQEHKR